MKEHERLVLRMMGWRDHQAKAIAAGMERQPLWKPEWIKRMNDYCGEREQDGINCQASFLTSTLRNSHKQIGDKLKAAETEEEAHVALKEFWEAVESGES
jgi:hypothetical protein